MSTSRSKKPAQQTEGALRPSDHVDSVASDAPVVNPKLGFTGWLRWGWTQLTSMRTAILLLLALAIAAIPGSLFPQRGADPNGVVKWQRDNPEGFKIADAFQLFDVYSSVWFSAIYLLLFISLIGCIIPRLKHHIAAMRSQPPRTPARLARLDDTVSLSVTTDSEADATALAQRIVTDAAAQLKRQHFKVARYDSRNSFSVSAESGYIKETGNLLFHIAMLGVLVAVGVGAAISYTGQRVAIEGEPFVNSLIDYQSIQRGMFVTEQSLTPYKLMLDSFDVEFVHPDEAGGGQAQNFSANMTITEPDGATSQQSIRLNHPLRDHGDNWYLLGNGYAPTVVVRNPEGEVVYRNSVPFLPQDANLTSQGVIKIADGLDEQLGLLGFFYPTAFRLETGALTSAFGDLELPVLTFNVYTGDLGIDSGVPMSVYELDISGMTQLAGGQSRVAAIELRPGDTAALPNGLGTVEFVSMAPPGESLGSVKRFVSLQVRHDPTTGFVLGFAVLAVAGLLSALFFPRRRMWVKATVSGSDVSVETAGLARGDDPGLARAIDALAADVAGYAGADTTVLPNQNTLPDQKRES